MTDIVKPVNGALKTFAASGEGTPAVPWRPVQDVFIQDQASSPLILPLAQELGSNTLAIAAVLDEYTIQVTSSAGMTVGNHIRIINPATDRFYAGTIRVIATNVITLDSPLDFAFPAGSQVTWSNINLAVNGSVTPVHFHLRTGTPSIPSSVDITRVTLVCECASAVDLSKFGDLTALSKGIVFRKYNGETGETKNIFNVKANKDLVALAYDWTPFVASNPALGVDGFSWRLTFNGQEKMGIVLRVFQDGQLGMIVQDDLSGLTSLMCIVEGHIVVD